jgi:hypothetical protein
LSKRTGAPPPPREGREVLRRALEEALKRGATALADRVRAEIAERWRPAAADRADWRASADPGASRVRARGLELTNREVAQTLFIQRRRSSFI